MQGLLKPIFKETYPDVYKTFELIVSDSETNHFQASSLRPISANEELVKGYENYETNPNVADFSQEEHEKYDTVNLWFATEEASLEPEKLAFIIEVLKDTEPDKRTRCNAFLFTDGFIFVPLN